MSNDIKTERRSKIIHEALGVFSGKDYREATISELSSAAGISDATFYEYFKSKEALFFAIPEKITQEAIDEIERILPYIKGSENKIRAIVQVHMNLYETNPHYSSLVLLQLRTNRKFHQTEAYQLVRKTSQYLLDAIPEGIDCGDFNEGTDPYLIRSMLLGTIEHLFTRWHLIGKPTHMMQYLDPTLAAVFKGIRQKKPARDLVFRLHLTDDESPS